MKCVIAKTRKIVIILVNFQDKLLQYKLLDYILVDIFRIAI